MILFYIAAMFALPISLSISRIIHYKGLIKRADMKELHDNNRNG